MMCMGCGCRTATAYCDKCAPPPREAAGRESRGATWNGQPIRTQATSSSAYGSIDVLIRRHDSAYHGRNKVNG
jgi:hypothetical protein